MKEYVYKEAIDGNLHFVLIHSFLGAYSSSALPSGIIQYCTSDGICELPAIRCADNEAVMNR